MLSMEEIQKVRDLYYNQGIDSIVEIARITGYNRKTIAKYVDMEDNDISLQAPIGGHCSKLDPYKPLIDKWLSEDKYVLRKERHNAKKIHERLTEEVDGYDCSYRTVANYVAEWKQEMERKRKAEKRRSSR